MKLGLLKQILYNLNSQSPGKVLSFPQLPPSPPAESAERLEKQLWLHMVLLEPHRAYWCGAGVSATLDSTDSGSGALHLGEPRL